MKKLSLLVCGLALFAGINISKAQDSTRTAGDQPAGGIKLKPVWIFGIHGVVFDDDGNAFGDLFNVGDSWNFLPYPSRITAERSLNNAWRIEASLAYSKSAAGKISNDNVIYGAQPIVAFDVNAKYDLNDLFGETSVFDPYTVSGLGYTHRSYLMENKKNTPTVNLGLGFNVWIYKGFGLNLQTTAKIKLNAESSNYLMHSAGIVYRLNFIAKDPSTGSIREQR